VNIHLIEKQGVAHVISSISTSCFYFIAQNHKLKFVLLICVIEAEGHQSNPIYLLKFKNKQMVRQ